MNTFKKKSLYLAVAGVSALGAGSASAVTLNADGLGQVLLYPYYTVRETFRATRTTRCCRSSTRPRRRRPSRSASSKARTAAKSSTSTCTCRRRTCGSRRSSRPRTAPASSRRTTAARTALSRWMRQPDAVRQLRVHRLRRRPGQRRPRPHPRRLRRDHRNGHDVGLRRVPGHAQGRHARAYRRTATTCDRARCAGNLELLHRRFLSGGLFGTMTLINVGTGIDFGYDAIALRQLLARRALRSRRADIDRR